MKYFLIILSFLIVNTCSQLQAQEISNSEIIKKMLTSISTIKTMKYRMKKSERLEGKMIDGEQEVKVVIAEKNPVKAYIYNYSPNPGAEVLWVKATNDEKALAH